MTPRIRNTILVIVLAIAALWPLDAFAQRRGHRVAPRASTVVVARPYYGYGYGFYDPFFWGYPGWYPYGLYSPYYGRDYYEPIGSARLQVNPKQAEVYADGYLVGTVDDFDGFLQRLELPPGEHELTFYLDGYRTVSQKVLFRPGATVKISYDMQPLAPGASAEPRPQAVSPQPPPAGPPERGVRRAQPAPRERESASRFGTIAVRVQPADAQVFIDGEEWTGPEGSGPLTIDIGEGSHDVEVRRDGYAPYRATVRVRAGETSAVNVRLSR